jgi:hypothetical protein
MNEIHARFAAMAQAVSGVFSYYIPHFPFSEEHFLSWLLMSIELQLIADEANLRKPFSGEFRRRVPKLSALSTRAAP